MKNIKNSIPVVMLVMWGLLMACDHKKTATSTQKATISDDSLMNLIQYQTFQYFWDGAEENSGLARERIHLDNVYPLSDQNVVTTGGSGFGIMAWIVGVEKKFITQEQMLNRLGKALNFLEMADRFHGVFPHWWEGTTGKVKPFSSKDNGGDLVETAFLFQGLLTMREYLKEKNIGSALIPRINKLWAEVEFDWYTQGKNVLYWHWSPQYDFEMNFAVGGYNECLIMYILGASSETHGINPEVYHEGWARSGDIVSDVSYLGIPAVLNYYGSNKVSPLFWAHYSYLGLNPKIVEDEYANYWDLNVNLAKIHYKHAIENPKNFKGYGVKNWGLTSSYSMKGYYTHSPIRDLGVIAPTAALSSFPYTPKESMTFLRYLYTEADSLVGKYGPFDAYSHENNWYVKRYLAIDQGPIPVMIENYRTGLLWNLFMKVKEVQGGLKKLGFKVKADAIKSMD